MNKNKRDPMDFNEQELDSLLKDFFQKEMPDDLMNPPLAMGLGGSTSPAHTPKRQTGLFRVFAFATAIILLVSFVWNQFDESEIAESIALPSPTIAESDLYQLVQPTEIPTVDLTESPKSILPTRPNLLFYSSENMSEYTAFVAEKPERYETTEGPVEQRNTFYTSNKVVVDSETGNGIKMTIPEFEIEIIDVPEDFE